MLEGTTQGSSLGDRVYRVRGFLLHFIVSCVLTRSHRTKLAAFRRCATQAIS